MNLALQADSAPPSIDLFVTGIHAGINSWEAAGKILVKLLHEDANAFKRIIKAHPWLTIDLLEVFHSIGLRTFYPMVVLLPRPAYNRVRLMPYDVQQRICVEPVEVVTRLVMNDKPVIERKPVAQLTACEAERALDNHGQRPVKKQIQSLKEPVVVAKPISVENVNERKPREVGRFAVSRGTAGSWRFEKTTASPFTTQNVRLEHGQCVIVLQEYGKDQE
jgi:hypothetical protein